MAVVMNIFFVPVVRVTGTARLVVKWLENVGEIGFVGEGFEVTMGRFEAVSGGIRCRWCSS